MVRPDTRYDSSNVDGDHDAALPSIGNGFRRQDLDEQVFAQATFLAVIDGRHPALAVGSSRSCICVEVAKVLAKRSTPLSIFLRISLQGFVSGLAANVARRTDDKNSNAFHFSLITSAEMLCRTYLPRKSCRYCVPGGFLTNVVSQTGQWTCLWPTLGIAGAGCAVPLGV